MEPKNKSRTIAARPIANAITTMPHLPAKDSRTARSAEVQRKTRETAVAVALRLDGSGRGEISTGVPFLDHMLDSFARHGFFDLRIERHRRPAHRRASHGRGRRHRARPRLPRRRSAIARVSGALATRPSRSTRRYAQRSSISAAASYLAYNIEIREERVGNFQTMLVHDFMKAMTDETGMNLHLNLHAGATRIISSKPPSRRWRARWIRRLRSNRV